MKKLLTLPNILKCAAAVFGLVAFFLMFAPQIQIVSGNNQTLLAFAEVFFGENDWTAASIGFVGYLLIGVAALGLIALFVLDNFVKAIKISKMVNLIALVAVFVLMILGSVFVFITKQSFVEANSAANTFGNWLGAEFKPTAAPIISGVLGVLAGLSVGAALLAPQLMKE